MRIKLIRCRICSDWYAPKHHCQTCGAQRRKAFLVHPNGVVEPKKFYYIDRARNIELVSAIPPPVHDVIERLVKYLGGADNRYERTGA